jgi:hypothetical protein
LKKLSATRSQLTFATGNGCELQVWRDSVKGLAPRIAPDSQFREFVLAVKTRRDQGVEVVGSSAAEFGKWLQNESARWGKVIQERKITVDQ